MIRGPVGGGGPLVALARVLGAAASGAVLCASFPPVGLWWAAPLAFALLVATLAPWWGDGPRVRTGAALGLISGFVFFLLLVPWVGLYVGAYAAWGLAAVEALYIAVFGAGAVPVVRAALAPCRRPGARTVAASLTLAGWWQAVEWVRSSWPWGGFPWGRLAFGQADGPLLHLAALGGTPLLGVAVAVCGTAVGLVLVRIPGRPSPAASRPRVFSVPVATLGVLAVTACSCLLGGLPTVAGHDPSPTGPTIRVAVVQGNVPRLGLDFTAQRRAVLDNHVRQTLALADRVDAGAEPRPDLVVWPENASDVSAVRNADAARSVTEVSRRIGAPIAFGTLTPVSGGAAEDAHNSYLVWEAGRGPVDRHDKRYIQPLGEWLPWRGLWERLFPIARSAGHMVAGTDSGVVHAAGTEFAVATCFEVAFDAAARGPVSEGAQVLLVPTNNATFGRSPMTYQQLAMSRVRAVEHHVPVVVAATSGVSAIVDAHGRVEQSTGIFEPAVLGASLPVGGAGTLATRLGSAPQVACSLMGLLGLAWVIAVRRREGAHRTEEDQ